MRVTSETVFAPKLTAAVRVDAIGDPTGPPGNVPVQNTAHLERLELDQVTVVGMSRVGGHSGDSDRLPGKNWEKFGSIYFRHLFAS